MNESRDKTFWKPRPEVSSVLMRSTCRAAPLPTRARGLRRKLVRFIIMFMNCPQSGGAVYGGAGPGAGAGVNAKVGLNGGNCLHDDIPSILFLFLCWKVASRVDLRERVQPNDTALIVKSSVMFSQTNSKESYTISKLTTRNAPNASLAFLYS